MYFITFITILPRAAGWWDRHRIALVQKEISLSLFHPFFSGLVQLGKAKLINSKKFNLLKENCTSPFSHHTMTFSNAVQTTAVVSLCDNWLRRLVLLLLLNIIINGITNQVTVLNQMSPPMNAIDSEVKRVIGLRGRKTLFS